MDFGLPFALVRLDGDEISDPMRLVEEANTVPLFGGRRAVAIKVGRRHGRPVVLRVFAGKMWGQGAPFYCSANGVWLTPAVPPEFIELANEPD